MSARPVIDAATEAAVRRFALLLDGRFPVVGVILFGSRARQTHAADSDADVAVLLDGEDRRVVPLTLALSDVAYDVLMETGINITPLAIPREQWEAPQTHRNPALLRNIAREGIRL